MPQQLDPNALSILLRNQPQIPMQSENDYQLESMIPEEQLFQAQEAMGQHGAASGRAYSVPSREALKQSGMAELRKLFGIQQAAAQAKAYPTQMAGEYGLQEARVKGDYDVLAAREKATADAAQRSNDHQFQTDQQGRQQTFQSGQNDLTRQSIEGRVAAGVQGRMDVAKEATSRGAANQQAITDRKTGGPNKYWGPDSLMKPLWGMLGYPEQQEEAPAPGGAAVSSSIAQTVATLRQHPQAMNLTFRQLVEQGVGAGSTPEEMLQLQLAWGRD